jgi:hypothetical protein
MQATEPEDILPGRFAALAQELRSVADELEQGIPPKEALPGALSELRVAFEELASGVVARVRALGGDEPPPPRTLKDLTDLRQRIREAEKRHASEAKARADVERVGRLASKNGLPIEGLEQARLQANALLSLDSGAPIDDQELQAFCALLILMDDPNCGDEVWHAVADRWGRRLATAACRGLLTVTADPLLVHPEIPVAASSQVHLPSTVPVEKPAAKVPPQDNLMVPGQGEAEKKTNQADQASNSSAGALKPTSEPSSAPRSLSNMPVLVRQPSSAPASSKSFVYREVLAALIRPSSPVEKPAPPSTTPAAEEQITKAETPPARLPHKAPAPPEPLVTTKAPGGSPPGQPTPTASPIPPPSDGGPAQRADRAEPADHEPPLLGLPPPASALTDPGETLGHDPPFPNTQARAGLDDATLQRGGELVWSLLDRGEDALALLLLREMERRGVFSPDCPPADVVELGLLAVCGGDRLDWTHRFEQLEYGLNEKTQAKAPAATLFTAAALALRSVLPAGSVAAVALQHLDLTGLPPGMVALKTAVGALVRGGLSLTHELMRGAKSKELAEARRERARRALVGWWEQSKKAQLRFARATNVWRYWMHADGQIGREVAAALDGDTRRLEVLLNAWNPDDGGWKARVHAADFELAGARARDQPIVDAVMRSEFPNKLGDLLARCRALLETTRDAEISPDPRAIEALERLRAATAQALEQLSGWPGANGRSKALERRLGDLAGLLHGALPSAPPTAAPAHLTWGNWLRVPGLRVGASWELKEPLALTPLYDALVRCAEEGDQSLIDAARRADEHSDYRTFRRLHEAAEATGRVLRELEEESVVAVRLRAEQHRDRLVKDTDTKLARALFEALLPEKDIVDYRAEVEAVQRATDDMLELSELRERLGVIGQSIESRRSERKKELGQRLEATEVPSAVRQRIAGALDRDDLQVAEELMAAAERGESLHPAAERRCPLQEFFPESCRRLNDWFEQTQDGWRLLADALDQPAPATVPALDLSRIDDNERRRSAKKLAVEWRAAKRLNAKDEAGQPLARVVQAILMGLDFKVSNVKLLDPWNDPNAAWLLAETEPLRDLTRFVLPVFGSRAAGRYRVLCTWDRPEADRLLHRIATRQEDASGATLVFFFGRLSEPRRRELAALSREQRRTFVVLDDLLLTFLLAERDMRLLAMFAAATPFTTASPYVTTAGRVDPEMFFGRRRERERLWDPRGAHLLYGGRQLGKTALLRALEREHHNPERGIVVKWIDLKEEGIGHARAADEIWTTIAATLREFQIVRGSPGVGTLKQQIEDWLRRDTKRRILLLLDEADAFLRADATTASREQEGFDHVSRLTAIMNATNGQFKVVFAGLHNVQRTARNVNSRLAHLGEPLCIGPLFGGDAISAEAKAALALVCDPLEALGLLFESQDLPLRILAHTNWYPSLTQLFCRELYEHILASRRLHEQAVQAPPYVIRSRDIDDAYRIQGLRDGILERFRITLDLDRRYRVIALCIAAQSVRDRVHGIREGFSLEWIRGQCLYWWARGFSEARSHESFRSLLDEMVGLGVLRLVQRDHYALRNPNVLNLLGNQEEIDRDLEDAITQEPAVEYEPGTFRRAKVDIPWLRNPLSAQQESELLLRSNGIRILLGLRLSGLDDLPDFLGHPVGGAVSQTIEHAATASQFVAELESHARERDAETLVVVVPHTCPWTAHWVEEARGVLRRMRARTKPIRVAFVADGHRVWQDPPRTVAAPVDFGTITLRPWAHAAAKRLLSDLHVPEAGGEELIKGTGGWTWYVHRIARDLQRPSRASIAQLCAAHRAEWLDTVRGDIPVAALPVLRKMGEWGDAITPEDLRALMNAQDETDRVLAWGTLMGIIERTPAEAVLLSPSIADALISDGPAP